AGSIDRTRGFLRRHPLKSRGRGILRPAISGRLSIGFCVRYEIAATSADLRGELKRMANPYLEVQTAESKSKVRLDGQPVTIGRHPENRLRIKDERASRFHCVIEPVDGGYQVRDLDSRNGTKLN